MVQFRSEGRVPGRRRIGRVAARVVLAMTLVAVLAGSDSSRAGDVRRGADLSFLPRVEAGGGVFRVDGQAVDLVEFLASRGLDVVRLRIWHTPDDASSGSAAMLALGERAARAGLDVMLAFHYSDTWADPGRQDPPRAWRGDSLAAHGDSVRSHTRDVTRRFIDRGIPLESVQIGNEITNGMLWPVGRVGGGDDRARQWEALATLLRAAIEGVEAATTETPRPPIVVHVDRGGDPDGARWFFDNLARFRLDFDRIGLSYYPWWHGTLDDLETTVDALVERYDKPVTIVETAYPWTLDWFDDTHNPVGRPEQLLASFAATPDGQRRFAAELVARLRTREAFTGVHWWAPEWIAAPGFGSAWENVALFDPEGRPLPALDAFLAP